MQHKEIQASVQLALNEDLGDGDLTAKLTSSDSVTTAFVISREPAILCGTEWFNEVFFQLDTDVTCLWHFNDGDSLQSDIVLAELRGPAQSILSGERTALNFLQTLSGTATITKQYVDAVKNTNTKILDTRKTLPGLRIAQKYAVTCGGGHNHRMGLYDGILIKENHISAFGSLSVLLNTAYKSNFHGLIEVEVETFKELQQAIAADAKRILLDNFSLSEIQKAVDFTTGRAELEASGGITLSNINGIAHTGVDYISVGALTKNVQAIDFTMRFS